MARLEARVKWLEQAFGPSREQAFVLFWGDDDDAHVDGKTIERRRGESNYDLAQRAAAGRDVMTVTVRW